MPNHVRNVWKINHIPKDKVQYVLNKITMISGTDRIIDFDLIIPEPRFKRDCPKYAIRKPTSCSQKDETRPWYDWYEFNIHNWGTKWNAYDGYTIVGKTYIQLVFSTAWSMPDPIAKALAEQLGYDMDLKWADEDYGNNCGRMTYLASEGEAGWDRYEPFELGKSPETFARRLWDRY